MAETHPVWRYLTYFMFLGLYLWYLWVTLSLVRPIWLTLVVLALVAGGDIFVLYWARNKATALTKDQMLEIWILTQICFANIVFALCLSAPPVEMLILLGILMIAFFMRMRATYWLVDLKYSKRRLEEP